MQKSSLKQVFIGIGANLGDRFLNLNQAIESFKNEPEFLNLIISPVYETKPVGAEGPDYLNAVIRFETALDANQIHAWMKAQEQGAGRIRTIQNAPRTLDLDLLFYGDEIISTKELKVPHPRLHERAFVLLPLNEIAPSFVHPVLKKNIRGILQNLPQAELSNVKKLINEEKTRHREPQRGVAI